MSLFKIVLLTIIFFGFCSGQGIGISSAAVDSVQEEWIRWYNAGLSPGTNIPADLTVDAFGNIYVTGKGTIQEIPFNESFVTIKYNSSGEVRWIAQSDFGGFLNQPTAIAIGQAGSVHVTGYSYNSVGGRDYATVKYDSSGVEQWVARYSSPGNADDRATDLELDGFGNVYVTGSANGDYVTVMYDSGGVEQWVTSYNGPGNGADFANAIELKLVDNYCENIYVTGASRGSGTLLDYATINYSPGGNEIWVSRYNGPSNENDRANALEVDLAGNVYVTGYSGYSTNTRGDYATIKYNSSGEEQWVSRFNGPPGDALDEGRVLGLDAAGNIYVSGVSDSTYSESHYTTIKYDTAGVLQWLKRIPTSWGSRTDVTTPSMIVNNAGKVFITGENSGNFVTRMYNDDGTTQWSAYYQSGIPSALALDKFGNICVTGKTDISGIFSDFATLKYNLAGVEQFAVIHSEAGPADDQLRAMQVDNDGNVYVSGSSKGPGTAYDYATVKYNTFGERQWISRYNHYESKNQVSNGDYVTDMAIDVAGNSYVTGYSWNPSSTFDFATVKYNAAGVEQWVKRFNGPVNLTDEAHAVAIDANGNVYVTGFSYGASVNKDYLTIKYNSEGAQQWAVRYEGPGIFHDEANALAIDKSGNVYITGYSAGSGSLNDYATIKYNNDGIEQWVARYDGPGNNDDQAIAIAVDDSGNVFVTGFSNVSGNFNDFDYATVMYNSEGIEQWVARYNGPGNFYDVPIDIKIDSSGNVFVTGNSKGLNTGIDIATINYNLNGDELWADRFNSANNENDKVTSLALDHSGNVYVAGQSDGGDNFITLKYNSIGERQWATKYNYPGEHGDSNEARAIALDGSANIYVAGSTFFGWSIFTIIKYAQTPTSIEKKSPETPLQFNLSQNYPNPFNPVTSIRYTIPIYDLVKLTIYSISGEHIKTLMNAKQPAGEHTIQWAPEELASGIYIYQLQTGKFKSSKKLVLLH